MTLACYIYDPVMESSYKTSDTNCNGYVSASLNSTVYCSVDGRNYTSGVKTKYILTSSNSCNGSIGISYSTSEIKPIPFEPDAGNQLIFNPNLFNIVVGTLLVTFIVGHSAGRIVRYLGKR